MSVEDGKPPKVGMRDVKFDKLKVDVAIVLPKEPRRRNEQLGWPCRTPPTWDRCKFKQYGCIVCYNASVQLPKDARRNEFGKFLEILHNSEHCKTHERSKGHQEVVRLHLTGSMKPEIVIDVGKDDGVMLLFKGKVPQISDFIQIQAWCVKGIGLVDASTFQHVDFL